MALCCSEWIRPGPGLPWCSKYGRVCTRVEPLELSVLGVYGSQKVKSRLDSHGKGGCDRMGYSVQSEENCHLCHCIALVRLAISWAHPVLVGDIQGLRHHRRHCQYKAAQRPSPQVCLYSGFWSATSSRPRACAPALRFCLLELPCA